MVAKEGNCCFNTKAKTREKLPAAKPLIVTIIKGSFAEILQVKLLSKPQRIHAPIMLPNGRRKPILDSTWNLKI